MSVVQQLATRGTRQAAAEQAIGLMGQQSDRPNVRALTPQAQGQMATGLGAAGWSSLGHLSRGAGVGSALSKGFMSPVGMGIMFANPKGRAAQIAADRVYLGTSAKTPYISARAADVSKGGLSDVNVRKISSLLGLVDKTSAAFDPVAAQRAAEKAVQREANRRAAQAAIEGAFPPPPPLSTQQIINNAVEKARVDRLVQEAVEKAFPPPPTPSFGAQVRKGLAKKLPAIAIGAAALPLAVASLAGLDRANRVASRVMGRAAESGRFNRAMQGFDPAQMGDPSFQYRYEQDPQGMNAALRESFGVLNRIAPSVAKDPTLAREYMKRLTLDPEYRQPPEEYLRQVQGAVQLENALQSAAPSLLEFGGAPAALLKGV